MIEEANGPEGTLMRTSAFDRLAEEQLLQPNQLMVQIDDIDQQGAVQITIRLNAFFVFHGI